MEYKCVCLKRGDDWVAEQVRLHQRTPAKRSTIVSMWEWAAAPTFASGSTGLGQSHEWETQRELHFYGPTGSYQRLAALPLLPAPLHLTPGCCDGLACR